MRHFIIISLALVFVLLAVVEHFAYRDWTNVQARHLEIQSRLTGVQYRKFRTEQLLRRITRDAASDPGLTEGLKKFGITFQAPGSKPVNEPVHGADAPAPVPPAVKDTDPQNSPASGS